MGGDVLADKPITAVIIENHSVVASGVRTWCEQATPPVTLIDAAGNINHVWTGAGGEAKVVIFDLCMRVEDQPEFEVLESLVRKGRKVVVFSGVTRAEVIRRCTEIGVHSYVTKDEGEDHLLPAVVAAADDRRYPAPEQCGVMAADPDVGRPSFSAQELEVLRAWCAGASLPQVARRLGLCEGTVKSYLGRAQQKYADLGKPTTSKPSMAVRLVEDGFMTPREVTDEIPEA